MPTYSNKTTGTIAANGETVQHDCRFLAPGVFSAQVSGTFVGTIEIEASMDGTNFQSFQVLDVSNTHGNSPSTHTSVTTPHVLAANAYALQHIRFRASAWTSGTANIAIVTLNA